MIYEFVNVKTGTCVWNTKDITLQELKKKLGDYNKASLNTYNTINYAIACHIPSEVCLSVGDKYFPTKLSVLSNLAQEEFWKWYRQDKNNNTIALQELLNICNEKFNNQTKQKSD